MRFISFSPLPSCVGPMPWSHWTLVLALEICPLSSPSPSNAFILDEQFNLPHPWQASLWLCLTSSLASHNTVHFYHTLWFCFPNVSYLYFISAPRLHLLLCVLAQFQQAQFSSQTHKHMCGIYSWQTKSEFLSIWPCPHGHLFCR